MLKSNSTIHKAAGLTAPSRSMILPGTIPETPISREWSRWLQQPLGVIPTTGRQLCEWRCKPQESLLIWSKYFTD